MSRTALQTVTDLPALVPCAEGQEDGFVRGIPVRAIVELKLEKKKGVLPYGMMTAEWERLNELKVLLRAKEANDLTAVRVATEKLLKLSGVKAHHKLAEQQRSAEVEEIGSWSWWISSEISQAMVGVQPCLWVRSMSNAELPQRGMLCQNVRAAIAYKMFFNGIRVCLRCHTLFKGKTNVDYCTMQCRETHRVARWRERQKLEAEQPKKGKRR